MRRTTSSRRRPPPLRLSSYPPRPSSPGPARGRRPPLPGRPARSARLIRPVRPGRPATCPRGRPHPCRATLCPADQADHRLDLALDRRVVGALERPVLDDLGEQVPPVHRHGRERDGRAREEPRTACPRPREQERGGQDRHRQHEPGPQGPPPSRTDLQVSGCTDINRHQKPPRTDGQAGGAIDHPPTPGRRRRPGNPKPR